jgi:hypothetical protein
VQVKGRRAQTRRGEEEHEWGREGGSIRMKVRESVACRVTINQPYTHPAPSTSSPPSVWTNPLSCPPPPSWNEETGVVWLVNDEERDMGGGG